MTDRSCRDRLEQALARIADPNGEGARTCLTVYAQNARAAADAADARAARGASLGPLDGSIVSIKDLFDVAGEPTRAGSKILAEEAAPATADAAVVRRLRAAGAVIVAKTNMTEFAFSGIGANPHFGTPGNPRDRARVPGGSSSGAAVAVGDGLCDIGIGTDTGGSVRIPAGLCGLVGFKPSRQRVPTDGAFPLSKTLDSIGPIANSVEDCAKADAVMAGEKFAPLEPIALGGLSFGIAEGLPLDRLDDTVAAAFVSAVARLDRAGVRVCHEAVPLFDDMLAVNAKGGIGPAEACVALSRPDAPPRRRYRPECPRADRARLRGERSRLCRHDARAHPARWRHGCAACAARRAGDADDLDCRADHRRGRGRKGLRGAQCRGLAQYLDRQLFRSVRHFAAAADAAHLHAGRPHADRA